MLKEYGIDLWDIINTITMYIDWLLFFIVLSLAGVRKVSNNKYIFSVISITLFMGFLNISGMFPNHKIVICMIVGFIFYKTSYKDSISKCIIINLLFWLGLIINESISIGVVVILNNLESVQPLLTGNMFRVQAIFISKLLLIIEVILFKYFSLSLEFKKKDMILIGIPILSNIASLLLIFGYNFSQDIINEYNIMALLFITFLIILSSVMLLIVIGKIVLDDKIKLEYELINERIKTSHKSYERMNEVHNNLRYVYHDLKNHLICIKSYDRKEDIISYVDNLEIQINEFEKLRNTGNKTLDIILGEKIYLCNKYGIEFEDSINISNLDFIQDIDICAIFANALDNAIEACVNINNDDINKKVEVKSAYINEFAIIKFTNTKVNDIKFFDNKIQTSKRNKEMHGIGLSSIKYIVGKYDGEVVVNYSEDEFILKIMIPVKKLGENKNEKNITKIT